MHYTHIYFRPSGTAEHRLIMRAQVPHGPDPHTGSDKESEEALKRFEADEDRANDVATPRAAASSINRARNRFINKVEHSMKLGLLTRYIPFFNEWKRARNADWVISAEAERLARQANPDLTKRNRFLAFIAGQSYKGALLLASEQQNRKHLAESLRAGVETSRQDAVGRAEKYGRLLGLSSQPKLELDLENRTPEQLQEMFDSRYVSVTIGAKSFKQRAKIVAALKTVEGKAGKKIEKYKIPASLEKKHQEEVTFRAIFEPAIAGLDLQDETGRPVDGEVIDALMEDNRTGGKRLVKLLSNDRKMRSDHRTELLRRAKKLRGGGWFMTAEQTYRNILDARYKTANVLPIDGRMKYIKDAPGNEVLMKLKANIRLRNQPVRKMYLVGRDGNFARFAETSGAIGRRVVYVINMITGKARRRGANNELPPEERLDDSSFQIL